MNALDVYVLSSSSEGFSLTSVQAMACGRPVVATRSGGPEEIVLNGETGMLVPTRSPDTLADALHELATSPAKREAFGRAGRQRALDCFSIDSMIAGYTSQYSQCLQRRKESAWQLSS